MAVPILFDIKIISSQLENGISLRIPIHPTLTDGAQPDSDFKVYPCTYCPYKPVCLFDVFENENRMIAKDMHKKLKGDDGNA